MTWREAVGEDKRWQFWIDRGGTFTDVVALRPDGQLITTANEIAERIADGPIEGLKAIVKAHDKALSGTLSEQLDYEKETQRVRTDSREFKEGVSAFVEKRKPNFRDLDQ